MNVTHWVLWVAFEKCYMNAVHLLYQFLEEENQNVQLRGQIVFALADFEQSS